MTNYRSDAKFLNALTAFVVELQRIKDAHKSQYMPLPDKIELEYGQKFVRIVCQNATDSRGHVGQRMVECFVALEDSETKAQGKVQRGDILKAGGYAAPAPKGIRSSVFLVDPLMGRRSFYGDGNERTPHWYAS